ncbi:MAG TPA: chemotaxis protein CheX [Spirochaetota bacterium]|nr:chemotaxis protein CheX [Spirochaetota bacterium]HPC41100.1 chemotaxis protein CheX [Spirochaetota bacterium]HPL16964.1 chemotaxis protein CheX [Spirochaetota bacterium]HQF08787.1 chemotaxis protein CheX [Spirochaetota bacterium]HQH97406.1 chemotaxis protein CheX [Spirochaetota bacterium]
MVNINAEFVNPFLEAASAVFKSILNVDLRRGKLVIKESPIPSLDVAILIGITGGVTGEVVYSMGYNMAFKIAQTLVPGLTDDQVKHEYKDVMGEMANMITGNAMNLFATTGKRINMTTPTVVEGKDFTITLIKQTTLGINLYSPMGQLEMNVALK